MESDSGATAAAEGIEGASIVPPKTGAAVGGGGVLMQRQDSTEVLEGPGESLEERMSKSAARRRKQQGNRAQQLWRRLRGQENPLPQSNPANWPKPTIEDLRERPMRVVYLNKAQKYLFCDNFIKTSKYEVWSFMPKFLAMEFHPRKKVANLYFLVVSCMQVIPEITSTFSIPILLVPLLFIVLIDMIFTVIEDISRHKADAIANAAQAVVLDKTTGKWAVKERWEVAVGDFVKVRNREEIPADMLVVGVHERYRPNCSGVCYVETKSLDGETNLKIRQVQKVLLGRVDAHEDLESFSGMVVMEHPNKSIASFTGSLEITLRRGGGANAAESKGEAAAEEAGSGKGKADAVAEGSVVKEPITPDNLLLRGTVLRNTKWATGLVLSTGHDTKVMMSIAKAPEKSSHLNARVNTEIKGLALMLFLFCFIGALGSSTWQSTHEVFRKEVLMQEGDLVSDFVVQFFYYLLLLYGFVPISLYVSQNFIRYFQSWFMDQDLDMYHEPTDTPSKVRTMNLNEDLGQITHVFSDKTGTLTQNVMDFRKCTVMGKSYGKGMTEIGQAALKLRGVELTAEEVMAEDMAEALAAPHVNFYDPTMFQDLQAEVDLSEGKGPLTDFLTLLALCHTVIPERPNNSDEIVLSASSPDDEALVLGAKYFGVEFAERMDTSAIIYRTPMPAPLAPAGKPVKETYDVLRILGFNSVRKRMSVVVRYPDGQVKVLAKGADTTMIPLLREDTSQDLLDTTMEQLEEFALEGLRTLMLGTKEMPEEEFAEWDEAYDAAINDLTEVAEQQAGRPNRIDDLMAQAEQGLTLLGGTAIEDKLQTGVGETIEKLIRGGMVVWVITGDKEETAINIGVACQLLWAEDRMDRCIINTKSCPTPMAVKDRLLQEFERYSEDMAACSKDNRSCKPRCLVIDGSAFALIEDAPLTSLHGPLAGETSLLGMAIDSPMPNQSATDSSSLNLSQTQRTGTAAGQETPSRFNSTGNNLRWRRERPTQSSRRGGQTEPMASTAPSSLPSTALDKEALAAHYSTPSGSPSIFDDNGGDLSVATTVVSGNRDGVVVGVPGGVPPGGDEKQEIREGSEGWGSGVTSVEEEGDDEEDEETGRKGLKVGDKEGKGDGGEDVTEVVVDAGDVLSAKEALLQFAGVCQAVVGCRMSPDQKRQLVHLIKDNNPDARTLAVGDGANDVPMIQAAHVGVGISGQEGLQAVNASDYSLAQFRFLQKLLLCHGRFNYRRMSFASSYLFYKSVSWAVPLFLYAFWNGLSGQVFYDIVNSTFWAILYTGLPIIFLGIYDMDVLPETALRYPWLYRNGVDDELLTKRFFWGWIAQGVLESCWVTIPLMFLQTGGPVLNGETPAVLGFGQAAFQSMTLVVNMKIIFIQRRWHWVEAALLTLSTGLLFAVSWILNATTLLINVDWEWFGMQSALFQDPNYWAVTLFGVIGVLMRDVTWKAYHRWWHPKLHHVLVEMEKGRLKDIDLPVNLRNSYSLHDVIQEDTSSRMTRMRTQSMQRIENHRDAVLQALGASGSGRTYSISSPTWGVGGSTMRHLDTVVSDGGRPRSAGGRLTSLSHLFEGLNKSPLLQGTVRRGRSAGSSPVCPGMGFPGQQPYLSRQRSGDEEQEEAVEVARVGFAFSQDQFSSAHEIKMIMRNRAPYMRRPLERHGSLPAASVLPTTDDAFQAHLRALQAHRACTIAEGCAEDEKAPPLVKGPASMSSPALGSMGSVAAAAIAAALSAKEESSEDAEPSPGMAEEDVTYRGTSSVGRVSDAAADGGAAVQQQPIDLQDGSRGVRDASDTEDGVMPHPPALSFTVSAPAVSSSAGDAGAGYGAVSWHGARDKAGMIFVPEGSE